MWKICLLALVVSIPGCARTESVTTPPKSEPIAPAQVRALALSIRTVHIPGGGSGTAWAVSDTQMVTADHVCRKASDGILKVDALLFVITHRDSANDICVIEHILGYSHGYVPLKVRKDPLQTGERIRIYGSPLGVPDILTEGYAAGHLAVRGMGMRRVLSILAYGGNSGSPVLDAHGRVVSVLVAGVPTYPNLSFGVLQYAVQRIVFNAVR